jgi:tetratricopeptide (TPR) repeat protein
LDPTYEREDVDILLFESYYRGGIQLANADRMEEALLRWSQALELRPDDQNVKIQQQLASLYLAGNDYWNVDWSKAVENFLALYEIRPGYKDAAQRLHNAYVGYGDQLYEEQSWCEAQSQYAGALRVFETAEVRTKHDDAGGRCTSATEATPTPSG